MTTQGLLLIGICCVLFGLILGMSLCLLIWHGMRPEKLYTLKKKKPSLSYTGDVRRTIAALQQLQAIIGYETARQDPRLSDFVALLRSVQRHFGRQASLEGVIQSLVVQDTERQLRQRKLRRAAIPQEKTTSMVREVVVL